MRNEEGKDLHPLYARILETVDQELARVEEDLSLLCGEEASAAPKGEALSQSLARLTESGTALRKRIMELLTSDAFADFDEALVYDAKRHVHTEMGGALTLVRACSAEGGADDSALSGEEGEKNRLAICDKWRTILRSLKTGVWEEERSDVKQQLLQAAKAVGIRLVFVNDPPEEESEKRDYVKAASAKIVAAVREGKDALIL